MSVLQSFHILTLTFCQSPRDGTPCHLKRTGELWGMCDEPIRAALYLHLRAWGAHTGISFTGGRAWAHLPLHGFMSLLWQKADHDRLVFQGVQVTVTPLAETLAAHAFSFSLCQKPNQHNPSSHPGSVHAVHSCHLEEETQRGR